MWGIKTFLIGAWLTITPLAQFSDTTSVVLLEFSESMSIDGLLDVSNYSVIDKSDREFEVYRVGIVNELDSIVIADTSLIALVIEKVPNKTEFTVTVNNVKDRAGNLITKNTAWHFFNGYAPNKFNTPTVGIK